MSLTGFNRRRREIAALKIAEKKQETVKTEEPKVEVKEEPKVEPVVTEEIQEEKPAMKKASKK